MKISYNWLKQFIDTDKTPEQLSQILTGVGLEVESLDKVQAIPGGLEGLVIGHVKESKDHPNSDHLHLTKVDVWASGTDLRVDCLRGGKCRAAGQKVVAAVVGAIGLPDGGRAI